jgi:glycosyltransferase involved in cell wall biosynthesis
MKKLMILTNHSIMLFKFRKELISELANSYKVFICVPTGDFTDEFVKMGCVMIDIPVDRRGVNLVTDLVLLFRYVKIILSIKPDIVITYSIKPNIYGSLASQLLKKRYFVNITGLGTAFKKRLLSKIIISLYKYALKSAEVVFFENQENKDFFLQKSIVTNDQACLLKGAGVNINEFEYSEYPECNDVTSFLFVGRIMKEKGVDELFSVIPEIKKKYPKTEFVFIGWYEDDYQNKVKILDKAGLITYCGFQADVRPFVKKSHCIILPSHHEGMSNTLLEGASMGRPLITSNIHGCKEVVIDKVTGFLSKVEDTNDLYQKIEEFIRLPYEKK